MKKSLFFVAGLLIAVNVSAQGPGGLRDSLKVWLKANQGITPSPTNTVPQWNEVSGANLTGNFITNAPISVTQLPPAYTPVGINFNPHVAFDNTKPNSLASTNQFAGNLLFQPQNNTILQVIRIHSFANTGVWLKWQYSNTSDRLGFEMNNGSNPGQLRFDFNGTVRATNNVNDQYVLTDFYTTTSQKGININGAVNITAAAGTVNTTCVGKIAIGNEPPVGSTNLCGAASSVDPYPTTIDIAEIIIFRRALSVAERNKVESYLAVKYGFTLDQSAASANNYTSANGTVIWNRTANLPFTNNITGIGRDDSSALDQRQSKSINTGAITTPLVTIYNGAFTGATVPASNVANANTFATNNSFELFGDNAGTTTFTRCYTAGGFLRMNRIWKAQQTGSVGTVTLAVNTSDVPTNTRHLIVGTDSAFTPGPTTTIYRLDLNNNILSKSITLPPNAFFTFASDSLVAHPTANSPLCEGSTLQLNSNITLASYSWTGPGFTSTAANPTIVAVTAANAGYYVLNGGTAGCFIKADSVKVVVSIKPAPPTIVTPLVYCMGDNALPLTAGGSNLRWYSQPVGGAGTTTPPIPNTAYEDTLTYWVTQSNQGCESIRSKQVVQIRFKPNGIILGTQSTICQGDVDTFYYYGNGRPSFVYDFKTPVFRTTVLSGSGVGPYIVRFDSAGVVPVRMQVNNDGCVSNDMFYYVTVKPSPAIAFTSKHDACVDEVVNVALYFTTSGVTQYTYDFAGGNIIYGTATGGPYGISWGNPGQKVLKLLATTTGCPSRITNDTITIHPAPEARFTASTVNICAGDSILFHARETDSNTRFVWTPNYFFESGNISESWGVVKMQGYVRLDVESQWGCKASDSLLITAKPCCELFFPNVFSPNKDGKNDVFRIVTIGHHQIANFRIVNRWGQTVFETKEEGRGWDGTFNGRDQDVGTYYYYIKYQCAASSDYQEQKGELLLIR